MWTWFWVCLIRQNIYSRGRASDFMWEVPNSKWIQIQAILSEILCGFPQAIQIPATTASFHTLYIDSLSFDAIYFYVYWTVHHLDSWVKRDQLDVTCFIISLHNAQHVSDVNTSIIRSLRLMCWVISWVVLLWFDVCWSYVVVWLWWCGIRMQAEALVPQPAYGLLATSLN